MNVASAIKLSGGNIQDIRIAVSAVSPRPMRLKAVEDAVKGKPANAETGEMAGKLAVQGAVPLQFNAYKIPLMRNLVKRAIGGVEEATWALITWAHQSVGTNGSHSRCLLSHLGRRDRGLLLHGGSHALRGPGRAAQDICQARKACESGHDSRARSPALAGRAAVPLDHGDLHVCAADHRVSAQGGRASSIG